MSMVSLLPRGITGAASALGNPAATCQN